VVKAREEKKYMCPCNPHIAFCFNIALIHNLQQEKELVKLYGILVSHPKDKQDTIRSPDHIKYMYMTQCLPKLL
jgi:hypothetical protein